MNGSLRRIFRAAVVTFGLGFAGSGWTQAVQFDLPAQPLAESLRAVAAQTNTNIVFDTPLVRPFKGPAISAQLTLDEALTRLLVGTGLAHQFIGNHTVLLKPIGAISSTSPFGKDGGALQAEMMRLAQGGDGSIAGSASAGAGSGRQTGDGTEERIGSSDTAGVRLDEIIVTAQKRSERLQDVPISIVALGADELQKRRITSMDDLVFTVPGLAMQTTGTWQRRIVLRGISNMFGSSSSLIGLYLDEAPMTSRSDMQPYVGTYDLERVEVLRGPQGTLYGEGSVGGTLRFITRDPQLDRLAMNANVAALFTEDGAPGQRIEGALNTPLIDDVLGLRIAGTFDHQGGWMDQPAADRKDINGQDLVNVRIKGLWQPAPQFAVHAMAMIHRNDAAPNIGEDEDGNFTQRFGQTTTPAVNDSYELYNLTLTYDFSAARLLSTTSYLDQDKKASHLGFQFPFAQPPQPATQFYTSQFYGAEVLTDELRLVSTGSGPWQWTVGGFYRDARFEGGSRGASYIGLVGAPLPAPYGFGSVSFYKSWAAFADVSYRLIDRLTLGAGLRNFREDQELRDGLDGLGSVQKGTFDSLNPRLYAQLKLTDRVNAYTSAAKGFRSGGFNTLNQPPYDPEEVWTYELGAKMSLLGGRLYADTALFYSDYRNYQIIGTVPPSFSSIYSNAGNAKIKGVEWEFSWRAADQLSLSFNGDYIDSEFYEMRAGATSHIVGDPLDLTPKYSYTLSAQRDFAWGGRAGFARLDYNQAGRATFRNRSFGPWYFSESDIINMLNFNAGLRWNANLSLELFAQNLLDDRGFIDSWSIQQSSARSRPRTYGVGFSVTFD